MQKMETMVTEQIKNQAFNRNDSIDVTKFSTERKPA